MSPGDILLVNARSIAGARVEVRVRDGVIAALGPALEPHGETIVDAAGDLLLPALVDSHMHLDKTLYGLPWQPHAAAANRRSRIETEKTQRASLAQPVAVRAGNLIERIVAKGTLHCRTHVDVDPVLGLENLDGVLAAQERYRDAISIQIVAFPQSGVIACPGTLAVMKAAIDAGADLLGGIDPVGIDGDMAGQLDAVFGLAERCGVGIDIHLHDGGAAGAAQVAAIAERTKALAMAGKVAISHGFCLGDVDDGEFARLADAMAESGVANITHAPGPTAMPPIRKLDAAGVTVAAGSDGIRDSWSPCGAGDMLARAILVAWRSGFRSDSDLAFAFDTASKGGAAVLGLADYGLAVGCRADFVTVPAQTLAEAVVTFPVRSLVVRAGRIVARDGALI